MKCIKGQVPTSFEKPDVGEKGNLTEMESEKRAALHKIKSQTPYGPAKYHLRGAENNRYISRKGKIRRAKRETKK